jgi:hypothetical protein
MRFHKTVLAVLISLVLFTPTPVLADPVRLISAHVGLDAGNPSLFEFTADGFTMFAFAGYSAMDFGPFRDCTVGFCTAGTSFDVGARITDDPLTSTVFPGVDLNGVRYPDAVIDGHILISGPRGIVPSISPPEFRAEGQYPGLTLDASLTVYRDASRSGEPLLTAQVFGSGRLIALFGEGLEPGRVRAHDLGYTFTGASDPIPEPATLLLVGAGLALSASRSVRGARRRTP